jgi:hypothetical protein
MTPVKGNGAFLCTDANGMQLRMNSCTRTGSKMICTTHQGRYRFDQKDCIQIVGDVSRGEQQCVCPVCPACPAATGLVNLDIMTFKKGDNSSDAMGGLLAGTASNGNSCGVPWAMILGILVVNLLCWQFLDRPSELLKRIVSTVANSTSKLPSHEQPAPVCPEQPGPVCPEPSACQYELTRGPRKGQCCGVDAGCVLHNGRYLCKRHLHK